MSKFIDKILKEAMATGKDGKLYDLGDDFQGNPDDGVDQAILKTYRKFCDEYDVPAAFKKCLENGITEPDEIVFETAQMIADEFLAQFPEPKRMEYLLAHNMTHIAYFAVQPHEGLLRGPNDLEEATLDEVSTPTVTEIEPITHDYYSPDEKREKKKKAEREKGYREEGRYEGRY